MTIKRNVAREMIEDMYGVTFSDIVGPKQDELTSKARAVLEAVLLRYCGVHISELCLLMNRTQNSIGYQVNRIMKTQDWKDVKARIKAISEGAA